MIVLGALSLLVLLQAYVGYPLSLLLAARLSGRRRDAVTDGTGEAGAPALPPVTLVISAYNEERCLRAKLENSLALDYPRDRLRIVVVSDGSTDATDGIARAHRARGVELVALAGRRGKVACLNEVIPTLTSELVVMSDANSMYEPDALRRLVRHFAERRIGCVCGRLAYANPGRQAAGESERVYWGYEG
ncbi:MAG TPA: glycosyltransferase, partial [Candidatus Polarisedimenticolia bacterium]|nr:glycosyltransferase [Candidatus Polarisedimenticolia bacterium]